MSTQSMTLASALALLPVAAGAATSAEDPVEFYLSDQVAYEDNLFRLPDSVTDAGPLAAGTDDFVNRATAGAEGRIDFSRQVVRLDLKVTDVRYSSNDFLDHVAGSGVLTWEWQLGSRWSGTLDARYDRALADFSNARFYGKDLVDTVSYSGEAAYRIGSRFRLLGGSRHTSGEHSARARRDDEFDSNSGWFGLEFRTPTDTSLRLEQRYTATKFPQLAALGSLNDREYDEHATVLRASHRLSVHTQLHGSYGRIEREYARLDNGDFSGGIWRVGVDWHPRQQLQVALNAWRDLRANLDAESDYFVSHGVSLTPTWSPTRALALSLALIYEEQEYIGSNPGLTTSANRADRARAAALNVSYTPMHRLRLDLNYRAEDRGSNRSIYAYDAYVAALNIRWAL
ncbi:MAG TPA: hypothetical protein VJS42_17155 [Steroidobacteraceae bacterium]|nr:hypothetical protein [Steroidobacteraceae bacterium]